MPDQILALHVTASASVVRGCCGQPDTDCTCNPTTSEESS